MVAAALLNALRVVGKDIGQVRTVISGAGAAGISIGRHLLRMECVIRPWWIASAHCTPASRRTIRHRRKWLH